MRAIEKINLIRNITDKIHKDFQDDSEREYFLQNHGFLTQYMVYEEQQVDFNRSESFLNVKKSDREIQKYDRNI
jgi:hypothetical protein